MQLSGIKRKKNKQNSPMQDYAQYANQMGIDVTDYSSLAGMGLDFGSLFGSDAEVPTGYEEFDTDYTNRLCDNVNIYYNQIDIFG